MINSTTSDSSALSTIFGSNCFSNAEMQQRLPKQAYKEFQQVQNGQQELSLELANIVANAMKDWALAHGATHFTHWFHPLNGLTAEKHDAFIVPENNGSILLEFSGKELIKGEPDASSFPSGGLRATFEARGYTAWDVTSPAFLKTNNKGTTLCIPTMFFSYRGHALDKKVPLIRSLDALNKEALRVLKAIGINDVSKVYSTAGAEQEYFLINKEYFEKRSDLKLTGRTILGSMPAKGQEMEDHYFGAIEEKAADFMNDLNFELWKLGVPAKTQHNEVAPNQFELATIYSNCNVTVDTNQLVMEEMKKLARHHGLEALLHEKPFLGVNGSGKHNNWSMSTDTGVNLLEPGNNPESNARFLLFVTAVIEAVDRNAKLLRAAAANAGNEYRLGAQEAPPAIISIFLGEQMYQILESVGNGKGATSKKNSLKIGITSLPSISTDISDRNRTSPFAFTGNKFEFRMVGSSQSVATPNTYLNTAVADVLSDYADRLEKAKDISQEITKIIHDSWKLHKKVVFNGNGYASDWITEAEKRGLPNIKSTAEALQVLIEKDVIALFEKHGILTAEESESRYNIYLEKYSKQVNIEAGVLIDMIRRTVLPAIVSYTSTMANDYATLAKAGATINYIEDKIKVLSNLAEKINRGTDAFEKELFVAQLIEDPFTQAKAYHDNIFIAMGNLRSSVDCAEKLVPKSVWPIPGYEEMLFSL